jgi:hypothetical protein
MALRDSLTLLPNRPIYSAKRQKIGYGSLDERAEPSVVPTRF